MKPPFYFIDPLRVKLTGYTYDDFNKIVEGSGYSQATDDSLHNYFNWSKTTHWEFVYEPYNAQELAEMFEKTIVSDRHTGFLVRLTYNSNLIQIDAVSIKDMLLDLTFETGMGWEAISLCGKYVMEFTDGFEYRAISNFKIV